MRALLTFLLGLVLESAAVPGFAASPGEKRVALVIGNSAYQNVSQLPNPVNDARAIADMFTAAGFETVSAKTNVGNLEFKRALRDFTSAAQDADVAVVFFAGHGIEVRGTNYLIPVDAKLATDYDAEDEAVSMNRVVEALETAKRLRLVILDACRDNPFNKSMQRRIAMRAVAAGLAKVEPATTDTLIAFAAKAGSTAEDGRGANSPFTAALLKHLTVPGRDIRIALGHVRDEVMKSTNGKQEPFVYGSLGGASLALVPTKAEAAQAATIPGADARRDYEFASQLGTKEGWDAFLGLYTSGFYADLARGHVRKLEAAQKAEAEAAAARAKAAAAERAKAEAEQLRAAAAEKAKAAEAAEKARAAEAAERAKAEAIEKAKAAEISQKAKVEAEAKAKTEAAERVRAEAELAKAAAAEKAKVDAAEAAKSRIAALTPPAAPAVDAREISRQLQAELRRVGCNVGAVDSDWTPNARGALEKFNKHAGLKLDTKAASPDALDAVKAKTARVCPLVCQHGYRASGETCVAIVCKPGFVVGDEGDCEKAKEKSKSAARPARTKDEPAAAPAKPSASSGKSVACNESGCQKVPANCSVQSYKCYAGFCDRVVCP
jgi:uncharacterized caspase-like protein